MKKRGVLTLFLLLFLALYVSHPWEWSLMDDTNFVLRLQRFTAKFGPVDGLWQHFRDLSITDRAWGLFRPSWWVYASTIYLLPSQLAYGLRLLAFYGIILFPVVAFAKINGRSASPTVDASAAIDKTIATQSDSKPTGFDTTEAEARAARVSWLAGIGACLLLCNRPLYEGLSCISMQEFSGCFFIALGLFLGFKDENKPFSSLASFIVAAWFKTPFLWFVILYCIGLWVYEKKVGLAFTGLFVSALTLFKAMTWARHGGYTSRITQVHLSTIMTALKNFVIPGSYSILLMVALILILFITRPQKSALKNSLSLKKYWRGYALLLGGLIYLVNLLPWGAFGYYFMGPIFLLSAGILFTVSSELTLLEISSEKRALLAGLTAFLVCFVVLKSTYKIYFKDEAVRLSRDWAMGLPREGLVIGYNGEEASVRFSQLMDIRTNHTWKNTVQDIPAEAPNFDYLNYYVISKEATSSPRACVEVLLDFRAGQICRSK